MKRACLFLLLLLTLSACENAATSNSESNLPAAGENTVTKSPPSFLAKDEGELSALDFETSYAMCEQALSEYYKAIWNGTEMDLEPYIDNANLKQYMQKKIAAQYDLFHKNNLTDDLVTSVDVGLRTAEYVEGENSYFYLLLDVRINKEVGSYGEPTVILVQSLNGKLVLADWYTNAKDSYDSMARGEKQAIDNPEIWNDKDWVENLNTSVQ